MDEHEGTDMPADRGADRLLTLADIATRLGECITRGDALDVVRSLAPHLLPGHRLVLNLQLDDAARVEALVLAGALPTETAHAERPAAGSTLARAQEIGPHRTDLTTSPHVEASALAAAGYVDRLVLPVTYGRHVVASLAVAAPGELTSRASATAQLLATCLSAHSHLLGAGLRAASGTDPRALDAQVVDLRQAAHRAERTDPLTSLPNRVAVFETIGQSRHQAQLGARTTFAFLDLDHYKLVNEAHGHAFGDGALAAFAERLRRVAALVPVTFGRVGGDEFAAVAHLDPDELRAVLESLADDLQQRPLVVDDIEVHAAFSAGVYPVDGHEHGIEEIVSQAEGAAYQAKRDGRGRVIVRRPGDPGHLASHREMRQVDEMRSAIRAGRLRIVAQPIRGVRDHTEPPMDGEALVRLHDEAGHTLLPDDFVSLAEQYDVVNALDRAVLTRVVELLGTDPTPGRISCNVAPHSLLDPAFVTWAHTLVGDAGIGRRLVLELTERLPVGRIGGVRDAMTQLRDTGVRFALDDFGAGTTSYGNLRELPVDVIKVDGALVRGAFDSKVDRAMVRGIVEVASTLDIAVVAEGIETAEQYDLACELGVAAVQGFYLGGPAPWPAEPTEPAGSSSVASTDGGEPTCIDAARPASI